jgi:hypothetical protein
VARRSAKKREMTVRDTTRGSFLLIYGGAAALSAMCLPDTVDPRGVKGK